MSGPQQTDAEKAAAEKAEAEKAAAAEAKKAAPKAEPPKRYAAYNVDLGKFVGGVRDTRKEAADLAKGIEKAGYTAEIREV